MRPDEQKIKDFVHTACAKSYASGTPPTVTGRPAAKEYTYTEGAYQYIDTYVGSGSFAGEEGVWINGMPCWVMNYIGRLLDEAYGYAFLMEALQHASAESPYRGPAIYQRGPDTYICMVQGSFAWFSGTEAIYSCGKKVCEGTFHGGSIT